jgi:formate dehydrogenase subunit gamma
MHRLIQVIVLAAWLGFGASGVWAADAASAANGASAVAGPPPGFVAPAEPQADDSNAKRAKTQPGNNAPFWRAVRESGDRPGISNLPGAEKGVLIQPFVKYPGSLMTNAGEAWRQVRNQWIVPYGGALIVIAALALALYYFAKGPLGHSENRGPRVIERFTYFERAAHWSNAIAFSVLAISGIVMAFGKFFLLPIIGGTLFGGLAYVLKTAHNFFGPLFAVSIVIVFVTFVRDNFPARGDLNWLLKGGGAFGNRNEPPSGRFNAGEKLVFWGGVFLFGFVAVGSGLVMDKLVPGLAYLRSDMQVAHMIHSVAAALMIAVFLLHIYIGTIGMRGAYRAMRDGTVDEEWAREHHAYWYEDIRTGKIPAQRTPEPARPLAHP